MQNIRWAVLGTGVIANEMAVALKKNGRNIDAVGNRTHEKAVAFAEKYGIKKVYDNYNDMFTDPDIDVIYITPLQGHDLIEPHSSAQRKTEKFIKPFCLRFPYKCLLFLPG